MSIDCEAIDCSYCYSWLDKGYKEQECQGDLLLDLDPTNKVDSRRYMMDTRVGSVLDSTRFLISRVSKLLSVLLQQL